MSLYQDWIDAKVAEKTAQEERRRIEDVIAAQLEVPETLDGALNKEIEGYKLKIVGRMSRKVDADKVQELARESGLDSFLPILFRWKPEINVASWKAADPSITGILAQAITVEPSRPSFTIEKE